MVCGCWIKAKGSNAAPALPAPNEPTPSIFLLLLFRLWAVGRGRHTHTHTHTHTHRDPAACQRRAQSLWFCVLHCLNSNIYRRHLFLNWENFNFTNKWNTLGKHAEYFVKEIVLFEDNSCITKTIYMTFFLQWNTKEDILKLHIMQVNRDTKENDEEHPISFRFGLEQHCFDYHNILHMNECKSKTVIHYRILHCDVIV